MAELKWFYQHKGVQQGPISHEDLCALFASKELPLETRVWREGMAQWVDATTVTDFRDIWGKGFMRPQPATAPPLKPVGFVAKRPAQSGPSAAPKIVKLVVLLLVAGGVYYGFKWVKSPDFKLPSFLSPSSATAADNNSPSIQPSKKAKPKPKVLTLPDAPPPSTEKSVVIKPAPKKTTPDSGGASR